MAKEYFFITKFHFFTTKYDISHKKSDKRSQFLKKFCSRSVNRTFAEGSHRNFPSPKKGASPPFLRLKTVYWGYFSFKKASVLSHGEGRDWTRCLLRFRPISSLMEKEGLDSAVIPFRQFLSQYERGMGQDAHFVSHLALRVTAGGRNP